MAEQIEIVHTRAGETMLTGTQVGDGSEAILRANHWRWSNFLDAWEIGHSRDQQARAAIIDATADALRGFGHEVSVMGADISEHRYSVRWAEGFIGTFEMLLRAWDQRNPYAAASGPFVWIRRLGESELEYWRGVRDQLVERGSSYSHETISKGDFVRISGHWREVVRANRRSVSVRTETRIDRAPYRGITGHRLADDLDGGHESPSL